MPMLNAALLGRLLKPIRAGEKHLAWNDEATRDAPATLQLTSASFAHGAMMPRRHAGEGVGDNVSPPLAWTGVPAEAAELVLVIEDPDAPVPRPIVHYLATGLSPGATGVPEGRLSAGFSGAPELRPGRNTLGKQVYLGPRPVPGHGPHRYVFQLFAVDRKLTFATPPNKRALMHALRGFVIARGRLDGLFERS